MRTITITTTGAVLAFVAAVSATAALAQDDPNQWTYKDWVLERFEGTSTQDNSLTCQMFADSPTTLTLQVTQSTRDAGPPDAYPPIVFAAGVNTGPMAVPEKFRSTWTIDGAKPLRVRLTSDYSDGVNTFSVPTKRTQGLLARLAKGNTLVVEDDNFGTNEYSLAGFSAVYRKMSEWCDFSLEGVLE